MGFGGDGHPKKMALKGGPSKKNKGKGGSRIILPLLEGSHGKKFSCLGGSCNFLMTLQKLPPAPPPYLVKNERSPKKRHGPTVNALIFRADVVG